ncbi:MAG: lactate permease LctP family transporter [Planctomycetia bacterium]|nr:lactate permease LctP family transporter [Planctomycetia bacterium]
MTWTQNYDPFGSPVLSTLVAALPVVLLLGLLATGRVSAHLAAVLGLLAAFLAAVLVFTPDQVETAGRVAWTQTVLAALLNGAAFGLFPIGWIVLAAIFLYSLTVETGQFEIVKHSVVNLSADRRIQALLIAFSFGAFIEGAAGFGTPVAISAALMMGAGFKPLQAAGLALIANTAPVAYGALGTPIVTLARVTLPPGMHLEAWEFQLSQMAGRQLPFFSLIVPVWLVWTMAGWRSALEIWPALLVCGGSFALVQFLISNLHGPWLVDVAGGVISMVALALFLRVWQPRTIWKFEDEPPAEEPRTYSTAEVASAWTPWALLTVFVFLWGIPQVKTLLGVPGKDERAAFAASSDTVLVKPTFIGVKVPGLHKEIARTYPVVPDKEIESATFEFGWLAGTGTGIFLAALVSAAWMRMTPGKVLWVFLDTCWRVRWPMFTIAVMLAIAFTTRFSGMDATLGLAFTQTGFFYPLCAALLGWLGVALTGSDTSSNALFGSLQTITARRLVSGGVLPLPEHQAMLLMAASNSSGGVMGKMIDAQSIVVAAVATGQHNQEGAILRYVFWHSLALALLMGLLVMAQAYWWTGMIPR